MWSCVLNTVRCSQGSPGSGVGPGPVGDPGSGGTPPPRGGPLVPGEVLFHWSQSSKVSRPPWSLRWHVGMKPLIHQRWLDPTLTNDVRPPQQAPPPHCPPLLLQLMSSAVSGSLILWTSSWFSWFSWSSSLGLSGSSSSVWRLLGSGRGSSPRTTPPAGLPWGHWWRAAGWSSARRVGTLWTGLPDLRLCHPPTGRPPWVTAASVFSPIISY